MSTPRSISAEVLLSDLPESQLDAAREKTATLLSQAGINIVAKGKRSLSVECTKDQFEEVFNCSVGKAAPPQGPGSDFGPISGESFTTDVAPSIPDQLSDEVESVHIQVPPSMF